MKKVLKAFFSILLSVVIIYLIYAFTLERRVEMSKKIETIIPIFAKMDYVDTHSGMMNDGDTYAKIYFSEKQTQKFLEEINQNNHWRELPMTEKLRSDISNNIDEETEVEYVENGYWFFLDRHSKAIDKYDDTGIYSGRNSYNHTVAIFDIDNNVLHFYERDT